MTQLLLATTFFVGVHLLVAGTRLRDRLVEWLGERLYLALYSTVSLIGIIWMSWAYGRAETSLLWQTPAIIDYAAPGLILIAFLLTIPGLTTPNPTTVGAGGLLEHTEPAVGMTRITRHPFLWGIMIWAATHIAVNGHSAAMIFFGGLLILAALGTLSIDIKRARHYGEHWQRYARVTSNIPFAAIVRHRNRLALNEIGWWRLIAAVLAYLLLLWLHGWLFGASPLPVYK
jgi:uncharacterized membrane protein